MSEIENDMVSRGCGTDHSGSRDEQAVGATAALAPEQLAAMRNFASEKLWALRKESEEEQKKVRAIFGPKIAEAEAKFRKLNTLYDAAVARCASHPWLGKIVCRTVQKSGRGWYGRGEKIVQRGVVEIISPSNPWNGGKCVSPMAGDAAVRLLKSDGKPGLKHARLNEPHQPWSLEDAAIQQEDKPPQALGQESGE